MHVSTFSQSVRAPRVSQRPVIGPSRTARCTLCRAEEMPAKKRDTAIEAPIKPDEEEPAQTEDQKFQADLARMRKEMAESGDSKNVFSGAAEEAGLIEWPTFGKALVDTAIVIAVVIGTSGGLFALNTLLAELSREVYGK